MTVEMDDPHGGFGDVAGPFGSPVPATEEGATLKANTLNLFDSTVVAVSSVAPAYTLAATMAVLFLTAGVGYAGPAVIWMSFVAVLFIAIAYFHLNRRDPDCGASYAWLSKLVSPYVGWFNGWVQVAASTLFCISAPIVAGQYTLQLFNQWGWVSASVMNSVGWAAVVAALWLIFITFICIWGIRWTTNFQWLLLIVEYVAVVGFSIWGIIKVYVSHPHGSTGFHFGWLNPFNLTGIGAVTAGIVLGVFFFWGWDTSANLNEETKNASKVPGQAGVISMFLLLLVFGLNIVAAQMLLPQGTGANGAWSVHQSTILFYFAQQAAGSWAGYVMIIAVISSTVATTQTTLLPSARITLSMARDRVWPKVFAVVHKKFLTPALGTAITAGVALIGILATTESTSVSNVFNNLILNIGVLIAFYYGITGLTCAWAYRKVAFQKFSFFVTGVLFPLVGGIVLVFVLVKVIQGAGSSGYPDIIVLGLGVPLVIVARLVTKGDFFKTKTIAYEDIEPTIEELEAVGVHVPAE